MSYTGPSSAGSGQDPDQDPDQDGPGSAGAAVDSFYVQALYDYSGVDTSSLSFRQGEVIEVLSTLESGWWDGILCDHKLRGWFPSNYVQIITQEDAARSSAQMMDWWTQNNGPDLTATPAELELAQALGHVTLDGAPDRFASGAISVYGGVRYSASSASLDPMAALDAFMGEHGGAGGNIFGQIAAAAAGEGQDPYQPAQSMYRAGSIPTTDGGDGGDGGGDDRDAGEFWVPRMTPDGQLEYFNQQTGQTSRDIPTDSQRTTPAADPTSFLLQDSEEDTFHDSLSRPISMPPSLVLPSASDPTPRGVPLPARSQTGDTGLLSAYNGRSTAMALAGSGSGSGSGAGTDPLARASFYSDDSALDNELGPGAGRSRDATAVNAREKRKLQSHGGRRKGPSTAQLLEPGPPPLLSELEAIAAGALQALVNGAGMPQGSGGPENEEEERERLIVLGEGVVTAVRTILHATGMTEATLAKAAPLAVDAAPNKIDGPFPTLQVLPDSVHAILHPHSRRLGSSLSKLTMTLRAVWGLLATLPADQVLHSNDPVIVGEARAARDQIRDRVQASWADAREARFEAETRARAEVLANARAVQDNVGSFLDEFARATAAHSVHNGGPPLPRSMLRAPKSLVGALKTNAAALLLPGGGFGGNWRGNGFVTLPAAEHANGATPEPKEGVLAYAYPSTPISVEAASALEADSAALLEEADALKATVEGLGSSGPAVPDKAARPASAVVSSSSSRLSLKPSTGSLRDAFPSRLLEQATQLQRRIAVFLNKAEDVDVAAGVDFELSSDQSSKANSPKPPSGAQLGPAVADGAEGGDKTSAASAASAEYQASVVEAKPLLAELEMRKQALYDVAPALLIALQEMYLPRAPAATTEPAASGQPLASSPLSTAWSAGTRPDEAFKAVLDALKSLRAAVGGTCEAMTALAQIAQVQASAPSTVRNPSLAFRHSAFGLPASPSTSSAADSRGPSTVDEPLAASSLDASEAARRRESVDSGDFFFSSGTNTASTTAGSGSGSGSVGTGFGTGAGPKRIPSVKQLFGQPLAPGWDLKRGSLANSVNTNASSGASDGAGSVRQSYGGLASPSRTKLAKVLGPDSPGSGASSPVRSMSYVEQLPPWLGPDYGPDEISFDMENRVRGGTLTALVIAAASHEGRVDSNYLSAFLMTYRTFCTSHELLDVLRDRYLVSPPAEASESEANLKLWETRKQKPIRARVANVLKSWVREHMEHDEVDPEVLHRIAEFAQRTMRDPVQSPQILKAVEERLRTNPAAARAASNVAPGAVPSSIVPRSLRKLKFMDIDPLELARQLTLRDSRLFGRITPQECLAKAWPKQFGSDAANISAMIDMSNAVTRWVTETILAFEDAKKRAGVIKQFVLVAERCLGLNNFSTLIHIVAGLNSTPVHRLKRTWENVSAKAMASLGMLNAIMKPDKNYKEYREALRAVAPPCVPFLGVYLTDWTFIGDGNADMLREKPHQINFNKRQKASELILMIKMHQTTSYNLAQVPVVIRFIEEQLKPGSGNPSQDDQRLYEISLQREPRENEDVKIARLLSESGFL